MYSVVLATMLTAGGAAPDWHGCGGCYCSCSGCWGNAFSSCHCCGGCWGCSGCYGCWGCSGCNGCWGGGCWGCRGCSGCYGGGCWGCSGCYGSYGGAYGLACYGSTCFGCNGCSGCACYGFGAGGVYIQPVPGQAPIPAPPPKKEDKKQAQAAPARITVHVPADAKLTVDGVACPLGSETRAFDTPKLTPGQRYYYTVKAEVTRDGKPRSETKRVIFSAGTKIDVEFTLPVETASR